MNSYEVYRMYLGLTSHFTSNYDYFKYNKKGKGSVASFEKRKDKHLFKKLSKQDDPEGFVIGNIIEDNSYFLIDYSKAELLYRRYQKRLQSLSKVFEEEIKQIPKYDFFNGFEVPQQGEHPTILKFVLGKKISLEIFVILKDIITFEKHWNDNLAEDIFWKELKLKSEKYKPFLKFDKEKYIKLLKNIYGKKEQEKEENTNMEAI